MAMAQQEDSTVMLSTAKHLDAHPARPFAAAQGDKMTLRMTMEPCHAEHTRYAQCKLREASRRPSRQTLRSPTPNKSGRRLFAAAIAGRAVRIARGALQRQIERRPTDVLPGDFGELGKTTGAGTNEAHGPSVELDLFQGGESVREPAGDMAHEQVERNVEGVHPLLFSGLHLESMKELSEGEASPELCANHLPFGAPEQIEPQVVFQQAESQFNVPSACVQADDFGRWQHAGVENIGQIAVPLTLIAVADQAHGVASLLGRRGTHPDNGIEQAILTEQNVLNRKGGRGDLAADPPEACRGEFVKPFKGKIAAIKEQKGSGLQTREHIARMNFAIGSRLWQHVEPAPELGAHIEETCQASGQEAIVAGGQPAQGWQPAFEAIQRALIEGQHVASERGQGARRPERSELSHPEADLGEAVLHGLHAVLTQAGVDRLITDSEVGPTAYPFKAQPTPEIELAFPATQEAHEHTKRQMGQGQFYRATSAALEHRSIGGRGTNREQAALQLFRLRGDCFWHHRRKVSIMSHERVPSFSVFKLFEGFSLSLAYLASPLAYLFGVGERRVCLLGPRVAY